MRRIASLAVLLGLLVLAAYAVVIALAAQACDPQADGLHDFADICMIEAWFDRYQVLAVGFLLIAAALAVAEGLREHGRSLTGQRDLLAAARLREHIRWLAAEEELVGRFSAEAATLRDRAALWDKAAGFRREARLLYVEDLRSAAEAVARAGPSLVRQLATSPGSAAHLGQARKVERVAHALAEAARTVAAGLGRLPGEEAPVSPTFDRCLDLVAVVREFETAAAGAASTRRVDIDNLRDRLHRLEAPVS